MLSANVHIRRQEIECKVFENFKAISVGNLTIMLHDDVAVERMINALQQTLEEDYVASNKDAKLWRV